MRWGVLFSSHYIYAWILYAMIGLTLGYTLYGSYASAVEDARHNADEHVRDVQNVLERAIVLIAGQGEQSKDQLNMLLDASTSTTIQGITLTSADGAVIASAGQQRGEIGDTDTRVVKHDIDAPEAGFPNIDLGPRPYTLELVVDDGSVAMQVASINVLGISLALFFAYYLLREMYLERKKNLEKKMRRGEPLSTISRPLHQ